MKIPVYLISGFLGSGKTTVLLNMIEKCKKKGLKTGIILNELGTKNVEETYFKKQNVKTLLNGCICCSIQDDLNETLRSFSEEDIDLLLIEGTGVANPIDIETALTTPEFTHIYELNSMITVVDGSHFLEHQHFFTSSKEIRKLLKQQISCASMVILNKEDLITESSIKKINNKLSGMLKEGVSVFRTAFGNIPETDLFKKRYHLHTSMTNQDHSAVGHRHNHSSLRSIQIEGVAEVDRLLFEKWIAELPMEVLRGKGIVRFKGEPMNYHFQFASGKLRLLQTVEEKTPIIILIGDSLNEEKLNQNFHSRMSE
ncbi:CobW family GTP-binding protein [Guptibacillus hwajinpoensis]|uniref:CobW family GTP-binding protein n=1 Tax=Guptibacillus hwajinpoensis TaxID=208199 RepID=UPI001CFEF5B7|nr:GTP-binding protein [Pseudalkalibacillus hwajinpoensis]WLR60979.1 GTP-binding protein [Pseudalkalibacillus hwajinpoensis]